MKGNVRIVVNNLINKKSCVLYKCYSPDKSKKLKRIAGNSSQFFYITILLLQSKIVNHHFFIIIPSNTLSKMRQPSRISSLEIVSGGVILIAHSSNNNQNKMSPFS